MNSLSVIRVIARYLENEMVTYVSLTQSKSTLVKGVAKRMLQVRRSDVFIDNSYHCLYSFCHLSAFVSSQLSVNSLIYQAKEIELKDKTYTNWFVIVPCFQGQTQLQLHICINGIFCSTIVAFA